MLFGKRAGVRASALLAIAWLGCLHGNAAHAAGPGGAQRQVAMVPPTEGSNDAYSSGLPFIELGAVDSIIRFGSGRAQLLREDRTALDRFVSDIQRFDSWLVVLVGHADRQESAADTLAGHTLADQRTAAIVEYLLAKGVDGALIHVENKGTAEPAGHADDCAGATGDRLSACLEADRRVEIEMMGVPRKSQR
jgi:OOP family OmpA-OmpF porin